MAYGEVPGRHPSRTPAWIQRSGLERLWRLVDEPKLFSRYARDGAVLGQLLATRLLPNWILLKTRRKAHESADAPLRVELTEATRACGRG